MNPEISIVMSVYNGSPYLHESIQSILNQTFTDYEFIIINDGSSDDSLNIIKHYSKYDNRVVVLSHDNIGLTKSLNIAINIAKGKYIARQDADDISLPERLNKQYEWFSNYKDGVLCGTGAYLINSDGELRKKKKYPRSNSIIKSRLFYLNPFIHSSVMFTKKEIIEIGLYNESFKYSQDYNLWCRLSFIGNIGNLNEYLVKHRVHKNSLSFKKTEQQIYYAALNATEYYYNYYNSKPVLINDDNILFNYDNVEYNNYFKYITSLLTISSKSNIQFRDILFIDINGLKFKHYKKSMYLWLFILYKAIASYIYNIVRKCNPY